MQHPLPRLKPSPIPVIHPIPEYAADERLAQVYEDTKSALGVPWMGVVTMAFAHYRNFYAVLWGGMGKVAASREFCDACADLQAFAEREIAALKPESLVQTLAEHGYGNREIDEIRAMVEVFAAGNMPYILIAATARLLLEGHALSTTSGLTPLEPRAPVHDGPKRLTLMEAHHADAPTVQLYADIRETLGLPFVNTDYRALARWPSYFTAAWNGLKPKIVSDAYEPIAAAIHQHAVELALSLPNPRGLTPEVLRKAATDDASVSEVLDVVRLFQWLLPGLAANVAYFKSQLTLGLMPDQ